MLPSGPSNGELGTRLDSWKEIAAYLNRDARTVQRWEKSESLPVHRHLHEAQASVYAYTAELDAWRENRKRIPSLVEEAGSETPPPDAEPGSDVSSPVAETGSNGLLPDLARLRPYLRRKSLVIAAGLVLALGIGLAGWRWLQHPGLLSFHERDWALVEAFENRTGEPLLDGTLRNAIERELNNSTFVYVVPRERIEDTLRLMRKPADSNLDLTLAREICLRDGGIRALVTGRAEKYGNGYVFSVELMDPVRNVPVATHSEAASTPDQMWPAVRKLSNWVRESLGESMDRIERSNQDLEKVTTPSLHAFQLFSDADRANKRTRWELSAQLLREAVAEDPGFASAHTWLAWDLNNLDDPGWQQEIQRAMDLSNTVSERERYFIKASYFLLYGQPEMAIPFLEALVRRYPDHYFGHVNLANAYGNVGRFEDARRARAREADLRPNDYPTVARAALAVLQFDVDQGNSYLPRARMLAELEAPDPPGPMDTDIMLSRFDELCAREDVTGAFAELKRQLQHPRGGAWPGAMAVRYFRLGRYADAKAVLEHDAGSMRAHPFQANFLFRLAFYSGKDEEARGILNGLLQSKQNIVTMGFVLPASQLGVHGWEENLSAAAPAFPEAASLARGTLALQEGRNPDAVALLQTAWDQHKNARVYGPWIAEGLSIALERSGNLEQAAKVLERDSTGRLANPPQWLRNEARLSGLYRRLHRTSDARRIEERLLKLLAFADGDNPILKELKAR